MFESMENLGTNSLNLNHCEICAYKWVYDILIVTALIFSVWPNTKTNTDTNCIHSMNRGVRFNNTFTCWSDSETL